MIEGQYLKARRKERGLTLQQLGELCEIPKYHLSRIENGKMQPNLTTVTKILTAMGLKLTVVPIDPEDTDKSEAWRQLLED